MSTVNNLSTIIKEVVKIANNPKKSFPKLFTLKNNIKMENIETIIFPDATSVKFFKIFLIIFGN